MNTMESRRTFSRRGALKLLSAGGVAATGGYLLYEYSPWLNYEKQANQIRSPLEKDSRMPGIIRYATLAANGHNAQPWKFLIRQHAIEIYPDYSRRLPAVDPGDRELWISLGCALENLVIAARAAGYASNVTYPDASDFIHIEFTADTRQGGPLFDAIPLRQNTRSEYDGKLVKGNDLDQVRKLPLEPGVTLHFVLSPSGLKTVGEYVNQANRSQYADPVFVKELTQWLRFNKREALGSLDGLYSKCSGNPEVPRWLGRMFVVGGGADGKKLLSSSGAVVVASEAEGKTAWVRTGQVYERMALTMTSLNIKSAFLNEPIEIADVRGPFQSAVGLGKARPQLLVRFGYANPMPRSVRRSVEHVLMQA